ncbi:MAG: ankyrin repeat domain-containing protein [Planctomycetaceae bacterium]|nr:ankyrin repeat domain-containing protein [Planctomycetaceae bacterium]
METNQFQFTAEEQAEIDGFCKRYGSDVKMVDKEGYTLLHKAATYGNNVVVKFLVLKGADVNEKVQDDWTPLHAAALGKGNIEVAKFLVSKGAEVNAKTTDGYTPLDAAKSRKHKAMVKYLRSVGAV